MSAGRKEQIKAMQRWGNPGVPWPGRDNCTAREVAGNISVLSEPSLLSLLPAKQQCISRPRALSLMSRQSDSHWLPKSSSFISHHACAQHRSVAPCPAGTDRSEKVQDTPCVSWVLHSLVLQLKDHHTGFMLVKFFTAFFTYCLILRGTCSKVLATNYHIYVLLNAEYFYQYQQFSPS